MYRNKISDGIEDLKTGLGIPNDQIYAGVGSKPGTNPGPTMKDLFKGICVAFKLSGEASKVIWKEMKDEIARKYPIPTEFKDMIRKYGRKNPDK